MRHMKSAVTGTLQEKNGKFYLVLRIPDSTGKLHQKWVSTGLPRIQGNQRRAKQLLDAKLVELQTDYDRRSRQAGWAVAEVGEVPFDEVVRRWMTRKRSEVAPSTFEGYEHITARLLPYFRKLDLTMNEVSPTALESYCAFLLDAGLSANTVNHHLTLIKSVFNDEIRNGAPILNPVKCVKAPRVETFQGETLSVEQIGQLFRLFEGDPIEDIVRIGVIYGLRRSEILGLRWSDIGFETGTLQIRHKVAEVRINGKRQDFSVATTSRPRRAAAHSHCRTISASGLNAARLKSRKTERKSADTEPQTQTMCSSMRMASCSRPSMCLTTFAGGLRTVTCRRSAFMTSGTPVRRCSCMRAAACVKSRAISATPLTSRQRAMRTSTPAARNMRSKS